MHTDTPQLNAQIAALLQTSNASETDILGSIVRDILQAGQVVNNKAIIGQLLKRLESERDVVKLDIYRSALEYVVHRTSDDVIN